MQEGDERLRRLARWGLAAAGVGAAALAYATRVESTWLEVTRRELALPRLPAALDGLRIAHLSDFHRSQIVSRHYLAACVAAAMTERPDVILLTGDFVTRKARYVPEVTELLAPLRAPLGVWGVLGNHDTQVGAAAVSAAVEASGARMLRNRHARVSVDGVELWLAGVDCPHHEQYRLTDPRRAGWAQVYRRLLNSALDGIPADGFRVLLAHTPDVIRDAARRGVDLMLSGHTHGGQVRLPLLGATVVPSRYGHRYASGAFRVEGTTLYVSRGMGTVRFPLRFLCRPELAIHTLRQDEKVLTY
jgi:predicted MPP superfamily phosphohydrolase